MDGMMADVKRHVVLFEPEVHWNTGNIGRTCLGAGAVLHLIKPLGFSLASREVKRAGLDYWPRVKLHVWDSWNDFTDGARPLDGELALFTKHGALSYRELPSLSRLYLVFGRETAGLPPWLTEKFATQTYRIPMTEEIRSLNLSTSVGIALYESLKGVGESHFQGPKKN
jgi:tRNA (cytidine/uridine-2'-O-)-methyltransferase